MHPSNVSLPLAMNLAEVGGTIQSSTGAIKEKKIDNSVAIGAKYFTVGKVEEKKRLKQKQEVKDMDKERAEDISLTEKHFVNYFLNALRNTAWC